MKAGTRPVVLIKRGFPNFSRPGVEISVVAPATKCASRSRMALVAKPLCLISFFFFAVVSPMKVV
jgi:hypothetical protein